MIAMSEAIPSGMGRGSTRRVALYSHDTMGLGHIRRNMLIAQGLAGSGLPIEILLVTGSREASKFPLPPNVDALTLPAINKTPAGRYQSRHLTMGLPELIHIRSSTICAALDSFQPDLFIVDNVPRGVACELDSALEMLNASGRTRCILGLRDVLDEPAKVQNEWARFRNFHTIRRWYERVWIYGDPSVYDAVSEYGFSADVAFKTRYLGYLDQGQRVKGHARARAKSDRPDRIQKPYVLCLLGGGQDGTRVAEAFVESIRPQGMHGVLVTGPMMSEHARNELLRRAQRRSDMTVLSSVSDTLRLIDEADLVITMGGYNTVGEVLLTKTPALVIPRIHPRREQWIRADCFRKKGLLDVLHPDQIGPESITGWLSSAREPKVDRQDRLVMDGLINLKSQVMGLLKDSPVWCAHCDQPQLIPSAG